MKRRIGIVGCNVFGEFQDKLFSLVKGLDAENTIVVCAVGGLPHSFADWACQWYSMPYLMYFVSNNDDKPFAKKVQRRNKLFVKAATEFQFWWGDYDEDLHALWSIAKRSGKPIEMLYLSPKTQKIVEGKLYGKGKGKGPTQALQQPVHRKRGSTKRGRRTARQVSRA